MTNPQIHILLIEDDLIDRMACRRALAQGTDYEFVLYEAETGREGLQIAHTQKPDCVLLDYHLPDMNGLVFLAELRNDLGEIPVPVLMLTGADNASVAVEAMKRGAQDYLVKDVNRQYLELLPAVIHRVMRERRTQIEKKQVAEILFQSEAKYRSLVEQIPAIIYTAALDLPGKLLYISPQICQLGFSTEEWLTDPEGLLTQIYPEDRALVRAEITRSYESGEPLCCEYRMLTRTGEICWFLNEASLVRNESGKPLFMQGVLTNLTERKNAEFALKESQRLLRELAAQGVASREDELKHIAREIHDELGQLMTALRMDISLLRICFAEHDPALMVVIKDMLVLADKAIAAVRNVTSNLRPHALDMGVAPAISWLAKEFSSRSGISCNVHIADDMNELDNARTLTLFRIVQESLTNIARHAEASQVDIVARKCGESTCITIRDDGKGFDTALTPPKKSFGLMGIKERALAAGGKIEVTSKPGAGTTFFLIFHWHKLTMKRGMMIKLLTRPVAHATRAG